MLPLFVMSCVKREAVLSTAARLVLTVFVISATRETSLGTQLSKTMKEPVPNPFAPPSLRAVVPHVLVLKVSYQVKVMVGLLAIGMVNVKSKAVDLSHKGSLTVSVLTRPFTRTVLQ